MSTKPSLEGYQKVKYNFQVWEENEIYTLFIPEFGVFAKNTDLNEGYKELASEKKKYFQKLSETGISPEKLEKSQAGQQPDPDAGKAQVEAMKVQVDMQKLQLEAQKLGMKKEKLDFEAQKLQVEVQNKLSLSNNSNLFQKADARLKGFGQFVLKSIIVIALILGIGSVSLVVAGNILSKNMGRVFQKIERFQPLEKIVSKIESLPDEKVDEIGRQLRRVSKKIQPLVKEIVIILESERLNYSARENFPNRNGLEK